MYALKLTTLATASPFSSDAQYCGHHKNNQIFAIIFTQQAEGFQNDIYLGVFVIGERTINSQKFKLYETLKGQLTCYIKKIKSQIKVYIVHIVHSKTDIKDIVSIVTINEELGENKPTIRDKPFDESIFGSCFDEQNDEVYLLFSNHIEDLSGQMAIAHNQSVSFDFQKKIPFFVNSDSESIYFIFFKQNDQFHDKQVVKVDVNGTVESQEVYFLSEFSPSEQNGLLHVYSHQFIGPDFQNLESDFRINGFRYKFVDFGQKENHLFVEDDIPCEQNCDSLCQCTYQIQQDTIKIKQVLGCFFIKHTSRRVIELHTPDNQHYFIIQAALYNEKMKNLERSSQDDQTLFYENDAYSGSQLSATNLLFPSPSGQIIGIQHSLSKSYELTRIRVSVPQIAMKPEIIAGLVIASLFPFFLLAIVIFCYHKRLKKSRVDQNCNFQKPKGLFKEGNYQVQSPSLHKLSLNHEISAQDQKKLNQTEKCSICLEGNCNTYLPCLHFHHEKCIAQWFIKNNSCPVCRKEFNAKYIVKCK